MYASSDRDLLKRADIADRDAYDDDIDDDIDDENTLTNDPLFIASLKRWRSSRRLSLREVSGGGNRRCQRRVPIQGQHIVVVE